MTLENNSEGTHTITHAINIDGTEIRYHVNHGRIAIPGFDVNKYVQTKWTGSQSVFSDPQLRNQLEAELFGKVYKLVEARH